MMTNQNNNKSQSLCNEINIKYIADRVKEVLYGGAKFDYKEFLEYQGILSQKISDNSNDLESLNVMLCIQGLIIQEKEKENEALREENDQLAFEKTNLNSRLEKYTEYEYSANEVIQELEEQIKVLKNTSCQQSFKIVNLQKEVASSTEESSILKVRLEAIEGTKNENIIRLKSEIIKLKEQLSEVREDISTKEAILKDKDRERQEYINNFTKQRAEEEKKLKALIGDSEKLQSQLNDLKEKNIKLESEKVSLSQKALTVNSEMHSQTKSLNKKIRDMQCIIDETAVKFKELKDKFSQANYVREKSIADELGQLGYSTSSNFSIDDDTSIIQQEPSVLRLNSSEIENKKDNFELDDCLCDGLYEDFYMVEKRDYEGLGGQEKIKIKTILDILRELIAKITKAMRKNQDSFIEEGSSVDGFSSYDDLLPSIDDTISEVKAEQAKAAVLAVRI